MTLMHEKEIKMKDFLADNVIPITLLLIVSFLFYYYVSMRISTGESNKWLERNRKCMISEMKTDRNRCDSIKICELVNRDKFPSTCIYWLD